jgi:hypothetical protein
MTDPRRLFMLAALLGAVALWLLLPRGGARGRVVGVLVGTISLGVFAALLPGLGEWVYQSLFWILAGVTVVSAVGRRSWGPPGCSCFRGLSSLPWPPWSSMPGRSS